MVFDRRRRHAHRASRDARLSTGYERAIDSLKTSEKRGFHRPNASHSPHVGMFVSREM